MAILSIDAQHESVATLFLSYLGRAPEFDAMEYYTGLYTSLLDAQGDSETAEQDAFKLLSATIYADAVGAEEIPPVGNNFSYGEYVNWVYSNVLGRNADEQGHVYWTAQLESGSIDVAEFVAIVVAAAQGDERDAAYLANRTDVAVAYSKWDVSGGAKHAANGDLAARILDGVNEDPDTVDAALEELGAIATIGEDYTLSTARDSIAGTAGDDTINAVYVTDSAEGSTLTVFDSIDGGAGNDTLNIYATATANKEFPSNASVKNVETVNIHNAGAAAELGNAANYAGVTALWQIGSNADAVTNLQSTTVAGFRGTQSNAGEYEIDVQAAAQATSVNIALDQVEDTVAASVAGDALDTLNISGNLVDDSDLDLWTELDLTVAAGKDVTTFTLNTEVDVNLTFAGTAEIDTLDASGSTGEVDLSTDTIHTVSTGSAGDFVDISTATTAKQGVSVSTGAGDDFIFVRTTGNGTTTVDAGEGDDSVVAVKVEGNKLAIDLGVGADDIVILGSQIETGDAINGGDGEDRVTLSLGAGELVADDYVVLNKLLTNFESLKLTAQSTIDASKLAASYQTIELAAGSEITKVGEQSLVANGDLAAVAIGSVVKEDGTAETLGGTLNITIDNLDDFSFEAEITAYAETVNLTVDALEENIAVQLLGDANTANVTLVQQLNEAGDAYVGDATFVLNTSVYDTFHIDDGDDAGLLLPSLTTLTLSGNGHAIVLNGDAGKLVNVDASALNSVDAEGAADDGLFYISVNSAAETVTLGNGVDDLFLTDSTYAATDTIVGLNLVADTNGKLDPLSDLIRVGDLAIDPLTEAPNYVLATGFVKFTTEHTDLDLALKDAAALADDNLVFQLEGNTYIYMDSNADELLDDADGLVKLVGNIDLDLLIDSLKGLMI